MNDIMFVTLLLVLVGLTAWLNSKLNDIKKHTGLLALMSGPLYFKDLKSAIKEGVLVEALEEHEDPKPIPDPDDEGYEERLERWQERHRR